MDETMPVSEAHRIKALEDLKVLNTPAESQFDDLVEVTRLALGAKIALVSLLDADRQWFKAKCGLDLSETTRDIAFCEHAIRNDGVFIVPNATLDARFENNPLVTGEPYVRFYAGAPLITPCGSAIGTLCAIDDEPRFSISEKQVRALTTLADIVMERLIARARDLRSEAA
jgi:GAF domain-containing protein